MRLGSRPTLAPSPPHRARSRVSVRDCRTVALGVYQFVFGFGLSSVGGFILGFWLGAKLLYRR